MVYFGRFLVFLGGVLAGVVIYQTGEVWIAITLPISVLLVIVGVHLGFTRRQKELEEKMNIAMQKALITLNEHTKDEQ